MTTFPSQGNKGGNSCSYEPLGSLLAATHRPAHLHQTDCTPWGPIPHQGQEVMFVESECISARQSKRVNGSDWSSNIKWESPGNRLIHTKEVKHLLIVEEAQHYKSVNSFTYLSLQWEFLLRHAKKVHFSWLPKWKWFAPKNLWATFLLPTPTLKLPFSFTSQFSPWSHLGLQGVYLAVTQFYMA